MIAELVHLLLSILIRFTPLVGTKPVTGSQFAKRVGNESHWFAFWMPILGWVVVSLRHSHGQNWLPQRVVAAYWHGWSPLEGNDGPVSRDADDQRKGNSVSFSRHRPRSAGKTSQLKSAILRRRF